MLQWMGGSRKKITAARKGVKHRQQRFFERRKQQQSAEITEDGEEDNVKPRLKLEMQRQVQSLDILSLTRLCQAVPSAVEINAPVEKSSAKNQCSVSKGGHGMEHLEQIHGAAREDAFMNEAHKENCKLKTDSIIHGPEFESGRTKCLSPTKKDAATQWTPASALAAAECLLQKPKEVPQSTQVVKSRAIHGHLPSKSAVTMLKILSDDESGGLSNKKSPSEFYAAFPLKGIGLLNTHTPEDLVMQGGFDRRSQRKMQLEGESTEAHAKRIHNSPEAFLKGQRAWQSPMNESIDFQRSTGLDLDNMVLCKPCPDKNYFARIAKDLICDEESASTQPFKDTPKKIANRLSSLVTDKHKKWKTSTFEECMVLKFDVPSPSQKKREPKVNFIEAQQCRTDGTFALGHIYCREDRCEAVAGKYRSTITSSLSTESFNPQRVDFAGLAENKENILSTLGLSDIFETVSEQDLAEQTANFSVNDVEVTSSPNYLNLWHLDDSPHSNSRISLFSTPFVKLVGCTEAMDVTSQNTFDWNNMDGFVQVAPHKCKGVLRSASSNSKNSLSPEMHGLPVSIERARNRKVMEKSANDALNERLLETNAENSFLSSIENYSKFPCLDELLSQEKKDMSDNIQGDPKRRLVDAPKALKSFKDTQLSSLSSRRVNKKPTVMPVMPGVEANHTTALKTLHQKITEQKCNSDHKLRDADQHTFQHDEPALSATRHSKRGDKFSGSSMLEKVSSDFKVKIKIAQAGPGSKENRASKQQLPVEENMLTPGSSMDESIENSDPLQSRSLSTDAFFPALQFSSPGKKGELCSSEVLKGCKSKKRQKTSDSFPCHGSKPSSPDEVDEHQANLGSSLPEYVGMLESYVLELKLINEALRTTTC